MKFCDGHVWFQYLDGHWGWYYKKRVVPDFSTWGKACELSMSKWLK